MSSTMYAAALAVHKVDPLARQVGKSSDSGAFVFDVYSITSSATNRMSRLIVSPTAPANQVDDQLELGRCKRAGA